MNEVDPLLDFQESAATIAPGNAPPSVTILFKIP